MGRKVNIHIWLVFFAGIVINFNQDLSTGREHQPASIAVYAKRQGDAKSRTREGPPRWVKPMDKLVIPVSSGTNADLKCRARATPTPNITWLRNNVDFTHRGGQPVRSNRAVLKLTKVSLLDKANYTCIVSNSHGSLTWTYQLHVVTREPKTPPIFRKTPRNTTIFVGETAMFECRVISSTEEPHIQWIKQYQINGSYYDDKNHPIFVRLDGNRGIIPGSGGLPDPSILLVPNATYNDSGWYTCVASNSYGQSQYSAWLEIKKRKTRSNITNITNHYDLNDNKISGSNSSIHFILIGSVVGFFGIIVTTVFCLNRKYKEIYKDAKVRKDERISDIELADRNEKRRIRPHEYEEVADNMLDPFIASAPPAHPSHPYHGRKFGNEDTADTAKKDII